MPTAIGIAFLIAATYCFINGADKLFNLLIFSSLFAAASMTSGGTVGLQPYYFVACVFIARSLWDSLVGRQPQIAFEGKTLLLVFGLIGVLSAFILPFVFAGTPINDPKSSSDLDLLLRPPLHFTLGNLAQASYLVVQILVVFMAGRRPSTPHQASRGYWVSCYFLVAVVFAQFICQHTGISFPYSFIQNNPGFEGVVAAAGEVDSRVPGTFTEPSGAGLALAASAAALLAQLFDGQRKTMWFFITLMAIAMVRSSSALAAVAVVTVCLLLAHPIFQFPWHVRTQRLKRISGLLIVIAFATLVIAVSPLRDSVLSQTVEKSESGSFYSRAARDLHSLQLTIDTYGIGVGLGSNRPSSLVTSLLSNVGILGFLVFGVMYIRLLSNATGRNAWIRWAGCAVLIDMALGGPDITSPVMWIIPALAVRVGNSGQVAVFNSSNIQSLPASSGLQI